MDRIRYTDEAYGRLEDACAGCGYEADWFPTMEDVERFILPDPIRFVPFIVWLLSRDQALTESQTRARKWLYQILYDSVELAEL